jgi:hypothetical protein
MNAATLRSVLWDRMVRFTRIQLAIEHIGKEEGLWLEGEWSPLLPTALAYLILHCGGSVWIDRHPSVSLLPNPPLHAAGFRHEDMRRYRQLITMAIGDRVIHVYPEDGQQLIKDARREMAKEMGY